MTVFEAFCDAPRNYQFYCMNTYISVLCAPKVLGRSHLAASFSDILAPHETRFSKDPPWGAKMAPKMYFRRFPDLEIDSCEDSWCKPRKCHEKQIIWLQLYDKHGNYAATVCRFLKNLAFCSYCMQNSWASFNETSPSLPVSKSPSQPVSKSPSLQVSRSPSL